MAADISLKAKIDLGVVPTHLKFVGGLVPDANGRLPRQKNGALTVVAGMERLVKKSRVTLKCVQIPHFPGLDEGDIAEMIEGFKKLGLETHFILMIGGADPMNPKDEDKVVGMLVNALKAAKKFGIAHVSSTSEEEWMKGGSKPKTGKAFAAAVAQNVRVHVRACQEAGVKGSCIKNWHIEFLRNGEFQTFTDIKKCWAFVKAVNKARGGKFFKVLVDAAHCGDSTLTIPEHIRVINRIAAEDELGIFHASAHTTRGCLSTDDGWIGALLTACAKTGKLKTVFTEVFHHEDPALQALRDMDPGHGIDTTDGRTYDQVVVDGVTDVARRLNNLVAREMLR